MCGDGAEERGILMNCLEVVCPIWLSCWKWLRHDFFMNVVCKIKYIYYFCINKSRPLPVRLAYPAGHFFYLYGGKIYASSHNRKTANWHSFGRTPIGIPAFTRFSSWLETRAFVEIRHDISWYSPWVGKMYFRDIYWISLFNCYGFIFHVCMKYSFCLDMQFLDMRTLKASVLLLWKVVENRAFQLLR